MEQSLRPKFLNDQRLSNFEPSTSQYFLAHGLLMFPNSHVDFHLRIQQYH